MRKIKLLLKQHVGAPCAAIVKPGDKVEKGTLVATPVTYTHLTLPTN